MVENSNYGTWLGFGIGMIIGGFLIYAVLKSRQQPPAQMPLVPSSLYLPPPINTASPDVKESVSTPQVVPSAPPEVPMEITTYKNNEHWEIERSKDGAIKGINVVRDVKADVAAAD